MHTVVLGLSSDCNLGFIGRQHSGSTDSKTLPMGMIYLRVGRGKCD